MRNLATAIILLTAASGPAGAAPARQEPAGHVTGIGGIFVKSPNPKALSAWYHDALGMNIEARGGAVLRTDAPGHPAAVAWNAMKQSTAYMAPSAREFMLDFAVDDMDALLTRLRARGIPVLKQDDSDPSGRFAWIVDPDGTKIELWQARHP